MNRFKLYLQKKYALSAHGADNTVKGIVWTVITNLVVFGGIGILYFVMSGLVGTLVDGTPLPSLATWTLAVAAFGVVSFGLHYMQYHYTYSVVYEEVGSVRTSLAERLRELPLDFFAPRDLAELTETMMGDVDSMEHVWSHVLAYLYGAYVSTAFEFLGLLYFDWRLAVACLWGVPVAFGLLFGSHGITQRNAAAYKRDKLAVADDLQEFIENAREIRATHQEGRFLSQLYKTVDAFEATAIHSELVTGLFVNGASVIMRLGVATTVLLGAHLMLSGQVEFMVYFMFLLAITRVYSAFDQALALIAEVFATETSVERMEEILESPVAGGTTDFAPAGYDIRFDNVGFAYEKEGVLRGVSFTARDGEVTALVGPSGSGKSTCARVAARLWDHTSGSLTLGGVEVNSVDPETLMGSYSMVFQDVTLFDDSVMENIRLGRRGATDEEVLAAAQAANCDEFVSKLADGYATPIGENGAKLSGGERQRISIARALLKDAPVVLLDEATASLDVENETKVQGALSELLRGRTVLVIAHRMRTVMGADHVVVLEDGRVTEDGTPAELLAAGGTFARMAALQSEAASVPRQAYGRVRAS